MQPEKPLMKALKIQLKINREKKLLYNQWLATSNYVYNKTLVAVRNGSPISFQDLRNKLVTADTKKNNQEYIDIDEKLKELRGKLKKVQAKAQSKAKAKAKGKGKGKETEGEEDDEEEKHYKKEIANQQDKLKSIRKQLKAERNENIFEWELETPKEVRAEAVKDVCKAYKTVFENMRVGNIKKFEMGFRRKKHTQHCMVIPKSIIRIENGKITIGEKGYFNSIEEAEISMGKKTMKKHRNLVVSHDCRLVKKHNEYWLVVPVDVENSDVPPKYEHYCGIDPGIRSWMMTFGNRGCSEYQHNNKLLQEVDNKIRVLRKNHVSKSKLLKLERRKEHLVDELHWKTIHLLLKRNDILFYGDIKSHSFTRNNKNRKVNKDTNNLKFYQFKQRLLYKAEELKKKVYVVKEHFTTKTCSFCGTINKPKSSKVFHCLSCKRTVGRDENAAKNILMKGIELNKLRS